MIPWCSKFALTPSPLNTDAVLKQVGGSKAFHEFVLSGNEEALEQFYESGRQSPVLGGEEFLERIRKPLGQLVKEHPRYRRRGVQTSAQNVIRRVAESYRISGEEVVQGVRGKENEARKVPMYLVRHCCDQTLRETARLFGTGKLWCGGAARAYRQRWRRRKELEIKLRGWCERSVNKTPLSLILENGQAGILRDAERGYRSTRFLR